MFALKPITILIFLSSLTCFSGCKTTESVIPYEENGKYGFVSRSGSVRIPAIYSSYNQILNPGYIIVSKENKWGVIDFRGNTVIDFVYDYISDTFYDGMILVKNNGAYGYADVHGKLVIPCIYENWFWFKDKLAEVKKGGKSGIINMRGETVIPFEYDNLFVSASENLFGASKNGKWGFIDKQNNVVIPFIYTEAAVFSEGLAMVRSHDFKYGYINRANDTVIPFIYEWPNFCDWESAAFKNGRAEVRKDNRSGYINKKGEAVIPLKYYCIKGFYDGLAAVRVDNGEKLYSNEHKTIQYGYVDLNGKEYLHPWTEYNNYDWQIEKAPAVLPDFTDTFGFVSPVQPNYDSNVGYILAPVIMDGVYIRDSAVDAPKETIPEKITETKTVAEPLEKRWTLETMLSHCLNAFVEEPKSYPDNYQIKQVSVSYGLLIGGGNYSEDFIYKDRAAWGYFKKETLYKIIGSETLREAAWNWVAPYYKKAMEKMHPFHKQHYKNIAAYLKKYMNSYDLKKTENYLAVNEKDFAHRDRNGNADPYRKLSAFVDRLIIIHKVIDVKDARKWVNKLADDVAQW